MSSTNGVFKKLFPSVAILFLANTAKAQDTTFNWQELFYQSYYIGFKKQPPLRQYWFGLSTSNEVLYLPPLSYGLDAILAMYEVTDSTSYLDDAISITNNVIGSSQIIDQIPGNRSPFSDAYRGWIERNPKLTGLYLQEVVLDEIYFFQYVTRLLKDIHNNKLINQNPRYQYFYSHTLNFVETNIWDKWENRGIRMRKNKDAYLLLNRTHMASHWAYIAAELYFLTSSESRRKNYGDFVSVYNSELEKNFTRYANYIKWNSTWDFSPDGSRSHLPDLIQDVSHANLIVSYIVEARDLGLWKDQDAIQRLINTVKDILWDPQKCIFTDNIDGTLFGSQHEGLSVGSFQADGFVKLTRYNSNLFSIYEKFISCSPMIINWRQYGQLFANLALSKKLLKEQK